LRIFGFQKKALCANCARIATPGMMDVNAL